MKNRKKLWVLFPSFFIFSLLSPATASKDTCQISRALDFSYLNLPRNDIRHTDQAVLAYELDETLIRTNKLGEIIPGLAREWSLDRINNEITFKLSLECGWSDGTKITARDIVTGFQSLYRFGAPSFPSWDIIKGAREIVEEGKKAETLAVEALDDTTVKITVVGDPDFALQNLTYAAFTALPTHIKSHSQSWQLISPIRVTSGPFRILSSNRNKIIAVKNEHFCKPRSRKIQRMRIFNNNDEFIPMREFIARNIDIITDVSSAQLTRILDAYPEGEKPNFISKNTYRQIYLVLNSELNGLEDKEIRAAIRQGIDFPNLLEPRRTIEQYFKKANTVFYDLPRYKNIEYSTKEVSHEVGLKNLKAIMESKGYSAKNPMRLTIKTWPIPRFVTVSKLISSMLRRAHFEIKFVPSSTIANAYRDATTGEFDIFIGSWVLDYLDPQNSWEGLRHSYLPALKSKSELSDFGLRPEFRNKINKLNSRLVLSHSLKERYGILRELEKLLSDAHVILPLYTELTGILYAKELKLSDELTLFSRTSYWKNCEASKGLEEASR